MISLRHLLKITLFIFGLNMALICSIVFAEETLKLPKLVLPTLKSYAPSDKLATLPASNMRELTMAAKLSEDSDIIEHGIVWRVFKPDASDDGKLPLIATANGGTTRFALEPGSYLVHAAFGRTGITKRITIGSDNRSEILVMDAGGIKLNGVLSGGVRIPADKLHFDIYSSDVQENGERALILPDVRPEDVVRLNAGTYHIISKYGSVNAIIRSDLKVEAGKLTEATMEHKAAELTLKLVREAGGEAMADTAWSVVNPSGEIIQESVGAFASMVLAAGDYTVIAKNKDKLYQRDFTVVAGNNQDVEVLAAQ